MLTALPTIMATKAPAIKAMLKLCFGKVNLFHKKEKYCPLLKHSVEITVILSHILSARAFSEERLLICVLVNSFEAIYGQLSHFAKMAF